MPGASACCENSIIGVVWILFTNHLLSIHGVNLLYNNSCSTTFEPCSPNFVMQNCGKQKIRSSSWRTMILLWVREERAGTVVVVVAVVMVVVVVVVVVLVVVLVVMVGCVCDVCSKDWCV